MLKRDDVSAMIDMVRVQAERMGDAPALIYEGRTTSYRELNARSNQVANGLKAAGVKEQERVGYLGLNSDLYFECLYGAMKANAVLVGINFRLAPPEIAYVVMDAEMRVLFVGPEFAEAVDKLAASFPNIQTIIALDGAHGDWPDFAAWRDEQSSEDPGIASALDDDILQLYTSGTTGHPKGVQLTNRNYLMLMGVGSEANWAQFAPQERILLVSPLFHVAGVNYGLFGHWQGAVVYVLKTVDPAAILKHVEEDKVQHALIVPAILLMLMQTPGVRERDLSSMKTISYGASPIAEALLVEAQEVFSTAAFTQLYGMTEAGGGATYLPPEDHDPARGKLRSCGIPWPGFELRVVDAEGKTLGPKEVGEIVLRCDAVMKGYWNKPDATAKTVRDGWLHTGDAGYVDEDGYFYIHDRVKDMIVSGGENIYPAEVENALYGHDEVADVAVIGVPSDKWGEEVKAMVVLKEGAHLTADDLIAYCRTQIAGYKVPKSIDFIDMLPRNPSGKILRRELREPYWEGRERQVN